MAEKVIRETHTEGVETPPSPTEKSQIYHHEAIGHDERNVGLRIDGDDLDHMHEPKVRPTSGIPYYWQIMGLLT